ncbi:MAG: hypothetical protein KME20_11235 [Kaiparowitsia implicata GSE-PSE-MK54-09C]|nr:hypothetical protein [Kaiparowitsia implicata GSE-PSE-MK54-09C]
MANPQARADVCQKSPQLGGDRPLAFPPSLGKIPEEFFAPPLHPVAGLFVLFNIKRLLNPKRLCISRAIACVFFVT